MDEIEKAIKSYCRNPKVRESVCEYIQQEKYIQSMIEIFHAAEEQEDIDGLHSLHRCLTTISMYHVTFILQKDTKLMSQSYSTSTQYTTTSSTTTCGLV